MIKNIAIVGATHGNEFTGLYLAKYFLKNPSLLKRDSFDTKVIIANPKAVKLTRRYVDRDLNRSFNIKDLHDESLSSYEDYVAKVLNAKLGPKGSKNPKCDFILDLHTTTANMGLSIVVSSDDKLTWEAIYYLCQIEPNLKVFRWLGDEENSFLDSITKSGFAIEVGAVPQGVLRADLFIKTKQLIYHLLDFFEKYNKNEISQDKKSLIIYDHVELVDYPRDERGEIIAMVHPNRQDRDFELINRGDPMFLGFDEREFLYEKQEPLYGVFINEAAYYEKGFAMCLSEKKEVEI